MANEYDVPPRHTSVCFFFTWELSLRHLLIVYKFSSLISGPSESCYNACSSFPVGCVMSSTTSLSFPSPASEAGQCGKWEQEVQSGSKVRFCVPFCLSSKLNGAFINDTYLSLPFKFFLNFLFWINFRYLERCNNSTEYSCTQLTQLHLMLILLCNILCNHSKLIKTRQLTLLQYY